MKRLLISTILGLMATMPLLGIEQPAPQPLKGPTHYTLISADEHEVIVQPRFLESSEPLKAMFSSGLKEAQEKRAKIALNGQALEQLVNLMHVAEDKNKDKKQLKADLKKTITESENVGEHILDVLRVAEEWQTHPQVQTHIAEHAASMIFDDEQQITEFTKVMPVDEQLQLLKHLPLTPANCIPALKALALIHKSPESQANAEIKADYNVCLQEFTHYMIDSLKELVAYHKPQELARIIESADMNYIAPIFKQKLYEILGTTTARKFDGSVYALADVDKDTIAVGTGNGGYTWNIKNNSISEFGIKESIILSLAHLNRATLVAGYHDGQICLHHTQSDRKGMLHKRDTHGVRHLLCDNNRIISAEFGKHTIQIWDTNTGQEICKCSGHTKNINNVLVLDPSHIASSSEDGTVRIWDSTIGNELQRFNHGNAIWALMQLGQHYIASFGKTIKIWDLRTGNDVTESAGNEYSLISCDQKPNNAYGSHAIIAKATANGITLKQLFNTIRSVEQVQMVMPIDAHHLISVHAKDAEYVTADRRNLDLSIRVWESIHAMRLQK